MRYWTVRVRDRWFFINTRRLLVTGIVILGISIISVFSIFQVVNSIVKSKELAYQKSRALELSLAVENSKYKIGLLELKLDSLINLDIKERLTWGLPYIDEDIRRLGVGGRGEIGTEDPIKEAIIKLKRCLDFEFASFKEISHKAKQIENLLLRTPSIWPTVGIVTSKFGWRNRPYPSFHKGIDIANRTGTPVIAPATGTVVHTGYRKWLGRFIELDHGFGYMTLYGHLSRIAVTPYSKVERGQVIGWIGNTGYSTGPHLYYEVRVLGKAVNPEDYIIPDTITY
ncbi:MAG: M23 family metallopeptidase [bacterium]|nr:M23 family metallopeptidase [bacterium]